MNKNWDEWAKESGDAFAAVGRPGEKGQIEIIAEDIRQKLELNANDNLLDVGCGSGLLISILNSYVQKTFGADFSENLINIARKNVKGTDFITAKAYELPYDNGMFDKVLCYSVFHYLENFNQSIKTANEFLRVAKAGGKILIGDIPSRKHFYAGTTFYKRTKSYVHYMMKSIVQKIRKKEAKKSLHQTFYIHKPSNWQFYDLDHFKKVIEEKGHKVMVLKQTENKQWGNITSNYRFDLLIIKGY